MPSKSGETKDELHQRAAKTLSEIINIANKENTRAILICSHAATLIAIGRALTGNPAFEVRTGVCTIGEYTAEGDDNGVGKWKCVRNGEATHLTNGEERHWDFGEFIFFLFSVYSDIFTDSIFLLDSGNYDFLDAQAQKKDVV